MRLYRLLNFLSIDVACGAIVCASFFARILGVQLRASGMAALGVTVWIIYTADRLLDVYRLKKGASSERHKFHQRNFQSLVIGIGIAVPVDLGLIYFVRTPIIYSGMALAMLVMLYFLFQRYIMHGKEVIISVLYTAGVILPSVALVQTPLSVRDIWLLVSFSDTALINLILFSWYGWQEDVHDNQTNLVTFLGKSGGRKLLASLFLFQLIPFTGLVLSGYFAELAVLLGMNIVLFILFLAPHRFSQNDLYRLIGDVVFIFPLPYLFLM